MGRTVDISNKLSTEKPKIALDHKFYFVDDSVQNVIEVTKLSESGDLASIIKALEMTLGKEACKEIGIRNKSVADLLVIFTAVNASIMDISYEEAEKRFQNGQ